MKRKLRIVSISDIHLGHHNTTTPEILENLYRAFPDNDVTGSIDAIFIGGDLFDRLLDLNDPYVIMIKAWMNRFLRLCAKRNIVVRLLEGTPSHDRQQNRIMAAEKEDSNIDVDFEYISTLKIEYIQSLDISVLWVPDEYRPETDDTWKEVQQLLQDTSREQVDFSVVHGTFKHQIPEFVKTPKHDLDRYLNITKYCVFGGHIHKASSLDRFMCNGSFDRISHGEEEPKGYWQVEADPNGTFEAKFIENTLAKKYITINCAGMPVEDALAEIRSVASQYPAGSAMRIRAAWDDPIMVNLDLLRNNYPTYKWSSIVDTKKEAQSKMLVDLRVTTTQVEITPANIAELMKMQLEEMEVPAEKIKKCLHLLEEFV